MVFEKESYATALETHRQKFEDSSQKLDQAKREQAQLQKRIQEMESKARKLRIQIREQRSCIGFTWWSELDRKNGGDGSEECRDQSAAGSQNSEGTRTTSSNSNAE